jgi:hypothetical protein
MLLKDLLQKVIMIVRLENEVDVDADSPKLRQLVDCANMIYGELTLEYLRLKAKQNMLFNQSGRVDYVSFSNKVREVLQVKLNGAVMPFETFPDHIIASGVRGARGEVTYVYHAPELTINSILILPPQYSERVVATGIASEYFYRTGMPEEAAFYKARYDNAVLNLCSRIKSVHLPSRRFLR